MQETPELPVEVGYHNVTHTCVTVVSKWPPMQYLKRNSCLLKKRSCHASLTHCSKRYFVTPAWDYCFILYWKLASKILPMLFSVWLKRSALTGMLIDVTYSLSDNLANELFKSGKVTSSIDVCMCSVDKDYYMWAHEPLLYPRIRHGICQPLSGII